MITDKQKDSVDLIERRHKLVEMQSKHHGCCFVCGRLNTNGFHAEFIACKDGSVEATLLFGETKAGYRNMVHGGGIVSLLDGAMTNCLFSYGVVAVTAEITTRLIHPVSPHGRIVARAWIAKNRVPLYFLGAELFCDGKISAKAVGKFVKKDI